MMSCPHPSNECRISGKNVVPNLRGITDGGPSEGQPYIPHQYVVNSTTKTDASYIHQVRTTEPGGHWDQDAGKAYFSGRIRAGRLEALKIIDWEDGKTKAEEWVDKQMGRGGLEPVDTNKQNVACPHHMGITTGCIRAIALANLVIWSNLIMRCDGLFGQLAQFRCQQKDSRRENQD